MSNVPYPPSSDPNFNQPAAESSVALKHAELDRTVQDLRIENTRLDRDVQQLRGRTAALIGLLIGLILLTIGGFAWLAISLQNLEKREQQRASGVDPTFATRVDQLEEQINDLTGNVPGNLADTLQNNQAALSQLQTQLQQVNTQVEALQQSPSGNQSQPNVSTPESAPSPQPSPDTPQPNP